MKADGLDLQESQCLIRNKLHNSNLFSQSQISVGSNILIHEYKYTIKRMT